MKINMKQAVFTVCSQIQNGEGPASYLKDDLAKVVAGEYGASKDFSRKLQGVLLGMFPRPSGELLYHLGADVIINDGDSIRNYVHAWRRSKVKQEQATQPATVTNNGTDQQ